MTTRSDTERGRACEDCGHDWAFHLEWPGRCQHDGCVCQAFLHAALATPPDTDPAIRSEDWDQVADISDLRNVGDADTDPSGSFVHPRLGVAALREGWNPNEATPGAGSSGPAGEWPDDPSPASLWAEDTDPSRLADAAWEALEDALDRALGLATDEAMNRSRGTFRRYRPRIEAAIHESRAGGGLDEAITEVVAAFQALPDTMRTMLERSGVVFDKWPPVDIPAERPAWTPERLAALDPEVRWQGIAFTMYTDWVIGPLSHAIDALKEAAVSSDLPLTAKQAGEP